MAFLHTLTDTWNNVATTWAAIRMNVTDSASAADSVLLELQTNGTSRMLVAKGGNVRTSLGAAASPAYSFIGDPNTGIYSPAGDEIAVGLNGVEALRMTALINDFAAPLIVPHGTLSLPSISANAGQTHGISFFENGSTGFIADGEFSSIIDTDGTWYWGQPSTVGPTPGSGNISKGTAIQPDGTVYFSSDADPVISVNRNATTGTIVDWNRSGVTVGSVSVSAGATAYNTSSDYRLKDRVDPPDGYDLEVEFSRLATDLTWYSFKTDPEVKRLGWMAHEFARTVPLGVVGEKDAVDEEGNDIIQMMDQAKSIPLIVARMDMLVQQVASLTAQIAEMRGEE